MENKYCFACGQPIDPRAEICPHCGVNQQNNSEVTLNSKWLIALLLCFFGGCLGLHRFYTGHTLSGILMIITLGGFGIWVLIDLILILVGRFKDKNGVPLRPPYKLS